MAKPPAIKPEDIAARIFSVRGLRVLLDSELAGLYGLANLISQSAISSLKRGSHGGRRKLPWVFTEHGAIMAAMVLNSPRAVQMSVYVVRAFVKLREVLASNTTLARRLEKRAR